LAALAFSIIGPVAYLRFLAMSWGGYALLLLLSTLILWLGGRLAVREFRDDAVSTWWYALLGLLAGLGWWTNPLIIAALASVGLILLAALRRKVVTTWRVPVGLAGFLVGSLPWWIWNFRHSWESLDFIGAFGRVSAGAGLKLWLFARFPDLLDLVALPGWAQTAGLIGIGLLVLLAAGSLVAQWRVPPRPSPAAVALGMAFLFLAVSVALFCRSHFAAFETSRYLLPLVPAMAVLVGTATAWLTSHARFGLGWAPLILLLAFQVWNARFAPGMLRDHTWELTGAVLNRELADSKIEAIYCPYSEHWLNAATGETNCFVDLIGERYRPYAWRGENARKVAFLDDIGGIAEFIAHSGGTVRRDTLMRYQIFHDFQPPVPCGRISASAWAAAVDMRGNNVLTEISDGNAATDWRAPVLTGSGAWIEISFANPIQASGIRFFSAYGQYPPAWAVDGMVADENSRPAGAPTWQSLTPLMAINCFFWSGPRIYWNGVGFRPECRFSPVRVSRLRVRFEAPERESEVYVSELTIFGSESAQAVCSESDALNALLAVLEEREIERLYSDRWVANAVALATGGKIWTLRESAIFDKPEGTPIRERERKLTPIRLDEETAVLVRAEEAEVCRKNLRDGGIELRETVIGPWVLFDFDLDRGQGAITGEPGLVWTGFNVLTNLRQANE
jgi:hypothetical protein